MNNERGLKSNPRISEEAAEWLIEFRSGDIDSRGRTDFDAWLRASPEHLRAFIEMAALWQGSASIDPGRKLRIEDVIVRAKAESNVIDLDSSSSARNGRPLHASAEQVGNVAASEVEPVRPRRFRTAMVAAAAAVLVVVMAVVLLTRVQLQRLPVYATEVGEQRSIRLADGSTVILDSRSQLRVGFDNSERAVELLQGRALFRVAHNPSRPFIVRADGTTVRAIGTQFDVNKNNSATIVTVVEGRVAVYSRGSPTARTGEGTPSEGSDQTASDSRTGGSAQIRVVDEPVTVSAGEQLRVTKGQGSAQPVRANVSSAIAWTQGQLVLDSASLAEVVEALNRYSPRKLVAEDHGPTPLRLSGVFATDPDFLIRYLRKRQDIVVRESSTQVDIVREAPE